MNRYHEAETLSAGADFPPIQYDPITKVQLVRYAGASGDFNPIHTDDSHARKSGLEGVIAQGLLVVGCMGQAVTRWVPRRCLKQFKVRLKAMTFPGDVIIVTGSVVGKTITDAGEIINCTAEARDQNGEIKVAGQFEAILPGNGKDDAYEA